ncbi:MAG: sugar transporter substrate-binding protein [Actinomycetia bacterium]|jgi:raffinose/stachyose/melibiose transport system substrate-binding protein|nr:sugar transporter substrate-binding protein [Actinomycetes bacterium]
MGEQSLSRRSFLSAAAVAGLSAPLLSACGGGNSDAGSSTGKVTVEWWNISTTEPAKSLWASAAKEYMAQHPDVTIKLVTLENEAYKSKMTALTASGKLPDIFHTWGGGVLKQQVDAGLVKDLTSAIAPWSGNLTPISLQPYQLDGKTYAVPFDIGMVGFWYNKALFAKAGITTPPATWAEFLADVKKLKSAGITPIAVAGKDKWPEMYYWAYLALRVGGLAALKQAAAGNDFTGAPFVAAGQHLKELADLSPFQQGFQGAGYDAPGGEAATMGNGKAAMELMGQWAPNVEKTSGKGIGTDLGFFPFPTVEGGQGLVTEVFGGGGAHALRKGAPAAAVDILKYFSTVGEARKLVASGAVMPVVKGAESALTDPNKQAVAKTLAGATGFQLFLDQAFPPAVGQEVNDSVAALVAGQKSPQQVAQAITQTAKSQ